MIPSFQASRHCQIGDRCLWAWLVAGSLSLVPLSALAVPPVDTAAFVAYEERSQADALRNEEALKAELAANQLAKPLKTPSGGDFKMPNQDEAWFKGEEAGQLAGIVLSYQTPIGGWSKHSGYSSGPRQPGMLWSSQYEPGEKPHYLATFDNRSTTAEIEFLAHVWHATQREDCKQAVLRGLDYVLAAQYPNGGWPQVYPLEGGYHDNITLNDDAMANILALLQLAASGDPVMECVDADRKKRCEMALNKGLGCVEQMQVVRDGTRSAWCAQHDPRTLEPVAARAMEPASLGSVESSNLLKFLMTIPDPDRELVACIEGGLAWLEKVAIKDMRREKVDGKTTYIKDPASTELMWARFYSLENDKPLYPGRDGVIYDSYEEMARNNKLGYDFLSTRPGSVVKNGQKKWRKMLAKDK